MVSQKKGGVKFEDPSLDINDDYDPDQNPEEKRKLRAALRAQDVAVSDWARDPDKVNIEMMSKSLKTQNATFSQIKAPQEAALDSTTLAQLSGIATAKARTLKHDAAAFDIDDFLLKMTTFLGGNRVAEDVQPDDEEEERVDVELDWEKLGWRALGYSHRAIGLDFMMGPLGLEQKKRNITKRAKQEKKHYAETRPTELKEADLVKEENESTKNIEALYKVIEQYPEENLFRVVCDPLSFGQTVENLFYLAFLIKDGRVSLQISEETGEIIVYAVEEADTTGVPKLQAIIELDQEGWAEAIKVWQIKESLFPHRPEPDPASYGFFGR